MEHSQNFTVGHHWKANVRFTVSCVYAANTGFLSVYLIDLALPQCPALLDRERGRFF